MKKIYLLLLGLTCFVGTQAQNAIVDIESTNKGILLPRLADTAAVANPAEGLFIYDLAAKTPAFHDGAKWQAMSSVMPPPSNALDSITYTITGLGSPAQLPLSAFSTGIVNGDQPLLFPDFNVSKYFDVNSFHLHKATILETTIPVIEFKFYRQGAATPFLSYKIQNAKVSSASDGGATTHDENYSFLYTIYGYKDWVNNQSFGWNLNTNSEVPY